MGITLKNIIIINLSLLLVLAGCRISGTVTDNGEPLEGVKVILSGDTAAETLTDENGTYEFTVINGDYTVTPASESGDAFFPSGKPVFVKIYKPSVADFTRLDDTGSYWDPSITVPIEAHPEIRGYRVLRGIIHLHSVFSHDACDSKPFIDGKPNRECYCQLREAICSTNQQYIMLTDHASPFSEHEFPEVLLYQPEEGDELLYENGAPVANLISCPGGGKAILTAGNENSLMPLGLRRMPDGTPQERASLLGGRSQEAVNMMHELGAMVFVNHSEQWQTEELMNLPIEGIEIYNLHANIAPDIRQEFLGLEPLGFLPDLMNMLFPSWDRASADLMLLSFLSENRPSIDNWDRLLNVRPTVGILGTDAHRNSLPFDLPDGDRADSYRRMMKWFANYVLVEENNLDEIESAIRNGRVYGAFQAFGEPVGFDYYVQAASGDYDMGDTVSISEYPVLHVKVPEFFRMDPGLDEPVMTVSIIRAGAEGGTAVAQSINEDLVFNVQEAGAYRAEIKIIPYHLKRWLGDIPKPFIKEYPFIYSNAIYIDD